MTTLRRLWIKMRDGARLMVGHGSYSAYRAHMSEHHPTDPVMTEVAFFRRQQDVRFGAKGGGRCC